jgi:DNA-binding CsgD family transcriptional regulator
VLSPGSGFVGRSLERERVRRACDQARAGQGGLVLVFGEAGIGKSQLVRAVAGDVAARVAEGWTVVSGACFDEEPGRAFGMWVEALGPGPEPAATLDAEATRAQAFDAWVLRVRARAAGGPLLILLEDLHRADGDALGLLRHLARAAAPLPVLLLGTVREPDVAPSPALAATLAALRREAPYASVVLAPFSEAEVAEALLAAAGAPLPALLVARIFAETGGNPFLVRECFRHLVDTGRLTLKPDGWVSDTSLAELGIPHGVQKVVAHRIDQLPARAREVVRLISLAPAGMATATVQAATGLLPAEAGPLLEAAAAARLLEHGPRGWSFLHELCRRAVHEALDPEARAHLHLAIAGALQAAGAPAGEVVAHFHASLPLPGAAAGHAPALAAAAQARRAGALERAAVLAGFAADLAPTPAARAEALSLRVLLCAEALDVEGALALAEVVFEARGEAELPAAETAAWLGALARSLKAAGVPRPRWDPLLDRALALVPQQELARARLLVVPDPIEPFRFGRLQVSGWRGYPAAAVRAMRASGEDADAAATWNAYDHHGAEAIATLHAQVMTWRDPRAILEGLAVLVRSRVYHQGDLRAALAACAQLEAAGRRFGSIAAQAEARCQSSLCHLVLGDRATGGSELAAARALVERLGPDHRLHLVTELALPCVFAFFHGGDWDAPAAAARARLLAMPGAPLPGLTLPAFACLAFAMSGDLAEATALLGDLLAAFEGVDCRSYIYTGSLLWAGFVAHRLGLDPLAARLRRLGQAVRGAVPFAPMGSADLIVGWADALAGDHALAATAFDRAARELERRENHPLAVVAWVEQARGKLRSGERAEARALARQATADAGRLGMTPWSSAAEALASAAPALPGGLTPREAEVLERLAAGRPNKEIAADLGMSVPTVARHLANAFRKLGCSNRTEAVAWWLRHRQP